MRKGCTLFAVLVSLLFMSNVLASTHVEEFVSPDYDFSKIHRLAVLCRLDSNSNVNALIVPRACVGVVEKTFAEENVRGLTVYTDKAVVQAMKAAYPDLDFSNVTRDNLSAYLEFEDKYVLANYDAMLVITPMLSTIQRGTHAAQVEFDLRDGITGEHVFVRSEFRTGNPNRRQNEPIDMLKRVVAKFVKALAAKIGKRSET